MAWVGLLAEFSNDSKATEKRSRVRRKLRLESVLAGARHPSKAVVLDLSEAGLLLHAHEELAVGDSFEVELPEAGLVEARVIWKRMTLYGCEFVSPVSPGVISATLLKADHSHPVDPVKGA